MPFDYWPEVTINIHVGHMIFARLFQILKPA